MDLSSFSTTTWGWYFRFRASSSEMTSISLTLFAPDAVVTHFLSFEVSESRERWDTSEETLFLLSVSFGQIAFLSTVAGLDLSSWTSACLLFLDSSFSTFLGGLSLKRFVLGPQFERRFKDDGESETSSNWEFWGSPESSSCKTGSKFSVGMSCREFSSGMSDKYFSTLRSGRADSSEITGRYFSMVFSCKVTSEKNIQF